METHFRKRIFFGVYLLLCIVFAFIIAVISTAANLDGFTQTSSSLAYWKDKSPRSFKLISSSYWMVMRYQSCFFVLIVSSQVPLRLR